MHEKSVTITFFGRQYRSNEAITRLDAAQATYSANAYEKISSGKQGHLGHFFISFKEI